ncbi:type III secretion system chaperone SpaK [Glaciimonas sp. PCH181]|uniref:InvB/SpaK family type III secretion system chaperone n=1 Tax=Glaciimonas sp. PCH181 TaxID=2133943 RepID=UPI000D35A3C9|nr:type III secretion system chaperone SpaK [Glaciimonas sp. PCH181]PUA19953.1 type III secretion system chaperone SpaK [Glaciimonas sp. PCH181]
MLQLDISQLVQDALIHTGCEKNLIGPLDSHSTIALDFHWSPTIYVSRRDDDIWLWCRLTEYHEGNLGSYATALIKEQMKKLPFLRSDHLNLNENEGHLELSGLIHPGFIENGVEFSKALEGFLERADAFREIVK